MNVFKARRRERQRGFSLTEVMLAIFILGIGVIAVAALFPAGIAQQQQSVDDVIGPIVANNALSIIRSKLRAEDFGTFEEHDPFFVSQTVPGDWPWLRPAFIFPGASSNYPDGAIDVFNGTGLATAAEPTPVSSGIPFSVVRHGSVTPHIVFTQGERYYPMFNRPTTFAQPRRQTPQYVWDCMFRKFQGKVLVAIFVYRAVVPGGGTVPYAVPPNPSDATVPPLPVHLPLDPASAFASEGPWDADGDNVIQGTDNGLNYNASDQRQSWQEPRQWILDQNNNLHRTLSRSLGDDPGDPIRVELVRPVSVMPRLDIYSFLNPTGPVNDDVVSRIWYIPTEVSLSVPGGMTLPVTLTPVYVTVREL